MYDLIIVGAGPAGGSAGRQAAQQGIKTLIIEKEEFPRYKPCGGALSEQALGYLDFPLPSRVLEKDIFGARIYFQDLVIERHKPYRLASTVTRSVFDNYLLGKAREAGVEVKMKEKVNLCLEKADGVEVYSSKNRYKAKYVIVAEGARGRLKKQIRKTVNKNEIGLGLVAEVGGSSIQTGRYDDRTVVIHFGLARMGYGWIFPHDRYYSVGIGGLARGLSKPRKVMSEFLKASGFNADAACRIQGHLIPLGKASPNLSSSRIFLCGDAAGFVDSFSGEGIAYAIRSGQLAAGIISGIVKDKKSRRPSDYETACEQEFGRDLHCSHFLSTLFHRFPGLVSKFLIHDSEIIDRYLEVIASKCSYKEYYKWLATMMPGRFPTG